MTLKRSLTTKFTKLKRRVTPTELDTSLTLSTGPSADGTQTPRSRSSSSADEFVALAFEQTKEITSPLATSSTLQLDPAFEYFGPASSHVTVPPTPSSITSSRRSTLSGGANFSGVSLNTASSKLPSSPVAPAVSHESTDAAELPGSSPTHGAKPSMSSSVYSDAFDDSAADEMASSILEKAIKQADPGLNNNIYAGSWII